MYTLKLVSLVTRSSIEATLISRDSLHYMIMDFITEHRATCRVTVKTQIECCFLEHK